MMKRMILVMAAAGGVWLGGCTSSIRPMKPLQQVTMWEAADGSLHDPATTRPGMSMPATMASATGPATEAATMAATMASTGPGTMAATGPASMPATVAAGSEPATQAATEPAGRLVMREIDPNETSRFIYKATYDNVWQQGITLLHKMGFSVDRQDYRDGVMITSPLPSAQIVEVWRPSQVSIKDALENTINNQRRSVRLTIEAVPGKTDFYRIGVQVTVERGTNPTEALGGPIFVEGSGFGRNATALRSDYTPVNDQLPRWVLIGHDVDMEKKVLDKLFKRI